MSKKRGKTNFKLLIITFLIVILTAAIGSLFTSTNTKTLWYEQIKPSITPPNIVFPIVWGILFFLIAISFYFALLKGNKKLVSIVFGINFILNIIWSILYFGLKSPIVAFFEIIVLWISILYMLIFSYKIDKKAGYLLVPYLIWVSFAAVLNYLSIK
jgi:translocator protein